VFARGFSKSRFRTVGILEDVRLAFVPELFQKRMATDAMTASRLNTLVLKRTCDACGASKVKCDGDQPCTRCVSRGIDCFYRARKKRLGKQDLPIADTSMIKKVRQPAIDVQVNKVNEEADKNSAKMLDAIKKKSSTVLKPQEKRSWTVFFSLYKNYNAGCVRFWFERQFARLQMRLEKENMIELLMMLRIWAKSLDVDYEHVRDRASVCMQELAKPDSVATSLVGNGGLHLHISGKVGCCGGHETHVNPSEATHQNIQSFINLGDDIPRVDMSTSGNFPEDVANVTINGAFENIFGFTQDEVNKMTRVTGSGLLPWGGDILCLVVPNENDIFAFMQIIAINLNWKEMGGFSFTQFPLVRESPSVHVIACSPAGSLSPVPFLVKCLHREFVDVKSGVSLQVTMTFEPMVPIFKPGIGIQPISPNTAQVYDEELPIADNKVGTTNSQNRVESPPDVYFPDVDMGVADEVFLKDLLDFARFDGTEDAF